MSGLVTSNQASLVPTSLIIWFHLLVTSDRRIDRRCTASAPRSADDWPVPFTDVAEQAGLHHPAIYGGVDRKRFILETNGCGAGAHRLRP